MSVDVFANGLLTGFLIGLIGGAWAVLDDLFGDRMPRLRDLERELLAARAVLAISRSAEQAQKQLLAEARRGLDGGKESPSRSSASP